MNFKKEHNKSNHLHLKIKLTSNPFFAASFRKSSLSKYTTNLLNQMQPKFKSTKNSRNTLSYITYILLAERLLYIESPSTTTKHLNLKHKETKSPDSLIKRKLLKIQNKSIPTTTTTTLKNHSGSLGTISHLSSTFLAINKAVPSSFIKSKKVKMNYNNNNNTKHEINTNTNSTTLYTPRNHNSNNNNTNNNDELLNGEEYTNYNKHKSSQRKKSGVSYDNKSVLYSSGNCNKKKSLVKNSFQPISNGNNHNIKNYYQIFNQFKKVSMLSPSLNFYPKHFNSNNNNNTHHIDSYNSSLNASKAFHNKSMFPSQNTSRKHSKETTTTTTSPKTELNKKLNSNNNNNNERPVSIRKFSSKKHNSHKTDNNNNNIDIKIGIEHKRDNISNIFVAKPPKNSLLKMKVNNNNNNEYYEYTNSNNNTKKVKKEKSIKKHCNDICVTSPTDKASHVNTNTNNIKKKHIQNNNNNNNNNVPTSYSKNILTSIHSPKTTTLHNHESKYDCDVDNSINRNDSLLQYININISRNKHSHNTNSYTNTDTSNYSYSSVCSTSHPETFIHCKDKEIIRSYIQSYYHKHKEYPSTKIHFYKYGRLLGKGAFAKVLLSLHVLTGRLVAIKTIPKKNLNTEHRKLKIALETGILKLLSKSNYIVKLYETYETQKHVCIVMEYICAGDLLSYIKKRNKLTESTAKYIFKQILLALQFIHQNNIIHRDIKLDNILIDLDNNIRVCDFGVSKQIDPINDTMYEQCGTPAYMAPELLMGYGYKGFNADLWSAGVVLYAMLSGTVPFRGNDVKEVHIAIIKGEYQELDDISIEAQSLLRELLEVDPTKRINATRALAHPWIVNVDVKNKEKYNLFTNAERVLLAKSNVDYRDIGNRKEMLERFDIRNIDTVDNEEGDKEDKEEDDKSLILAPYNSSFSTWSDDEQVNAGDDDDECKEDEIRKKFEKKYTKECIDLFNKELKIRNHSIKFKLKVKEYDRQYELNNNGEIDNGVVLQDAAHSMDVNDYHSDIENENENEFEMYNKCYNDYLQTEIHTHNDMSNNTKIINEVVSLGYKASYVNNCLLNNEFNYATSCYYLIKKYST